MHKKGLTQAEIGLTQPENRPNSNFRRVVACTLQESAEKKTLRKSYTFIFKLHYGWKALNLPGCENKVKRPLKDFYIPYRELNPGLFLSGKMLWPLSYRGNLLRGAIYDFI